MADGDDQDDADNLVTVRFGEPTVLPKERDFRGCQHTRVLVDEKLRIVECSACETHLDPVQVLLEIGMGERRLSWGTKSLARKRGALTSEIESLTKTRNNLKRQLQRLRKKTSP